MKYPQLLGRLKNFHRAVFLALVVLSLTGHVAASGTFPQLSDQSDYREACIDPREPELEVDFPATALSQGLMEGVALVSVAVDAEGRVTDGLVAGCSDMPFGRALLAWVKAMKFQPASYRGRAVPGRCQIGYHFRSRLTVSCQDRFGVGGNAAESGTVEVGNAMTMAVSSTSAGSKLRPRSSYAAEPEKNLDRPLTFTDVALPKLPAGYTAPTGKPVKVLVTFYIDEDGKARLPRVESAAAPELIAQAITAVKTWTFMPATVKGKPMLVYTARPVCFLPRQLPAPPES